jgi:hypothetical protein
MPLQAVLECTAPASTPQSGAPFYFAYETKRTVAKDPIGQFWNGPRTDPANKAWEVQQEGSTVQKGGATFGGDVVATLIRRDTADGADNSYIALAGGGAFSPVRGAYVMAAGNEYGTPGILQLVSGGVAGSYIHFNNGGGEVGRMIGGILAWGTTVTSGASAGDIVLPNSRYLRAANAAGTGTVGLVFLDSEDRLLLNANSLPLRILGGRTSTTAGAISKYLHVLDGATEYKIPLHALS